MGKSFWFDTETTGIDGQKCAIVQLGAIIEINGKPVEELEILMRPFEGAEVSAEALLVNKRNVKEIMDYDPWEKGMKKFIKVIDQYVDKYDRNDKFVVAGYNVSFDVGFLRSYFRRLGGDYAKYGYGSRFFNASIDVMSSVAEATLYNGLRIKSFKLTEVCKHFGIEIDAHNAIGDVRATKELYLALKNSMSSSSGMSNSSSMSTPNRLTDRLVVVEQDKKRVTTQSTAQQKLF